MDYSLQRGVQDARRATVGTNVLDMGAWIGLFAGGVFWSNFFWLMVAPTNVPEIVYTVAMAVAYAFVLPILLSSLVPSTPAGQYLQQTKWRTIGWWTIVFTTAFLAIHALVVLNAYWQSREAAAATGQVRWLAVGSLIVFVFVPAFAWVQAAPDRWLAEVRAAQAVKKLKLAQEANLMLAQTQYLRALSLMRRGLANLTAAEAEELAGTLVAFQRAENEAMSAVVSCLEDITGISTGINLVGDEELERAYAGITTKLRGLIAEPQGADYVEMEDTGPRPRLAEPPPNVAVEARTHDTPVRAHQYAETDASANANARSFAVRRGPSRTANANDAAFQAARRALSGAWSRADLERVLSIQKTKATELIRRWRELGYILDVTDPAHHYTFREVDR